MILFTFVWNQQKYSGYRQNMAMFWLLFAFLWHKDCALSTEPGDLHEHEPMTTHLRAPLSLSTVEAGTVAAIRKGGPLSRSVLQDTLGTSRANVTAAVTRLLEIQVLQDAGVGVSQGGRPPQLYGVNGRLGFIAGVDVGATSVDLALADFNGRILARHAEPADVGDDPTDLLGHIADLIDALLTEQRGQAGQVLAVGIGVPGPVKFAEGVLIAPPLMPRWESFPIQDFMRGRFPNARVVVDNDVNVMAIGEKAAGGGQSLSNFLFLKIGTGIGCGIICNGRIYRGHEGAAGDVGHICIDYNGPRCHCGNVGCLEVMAAGPAIAMRGREAALNGDSPQLLQRLRDNNDVLTAEDVGNAAKAGDHAANEIVFASGRMIGGMLAGLVNFFNPEMVFLGGGVSNIGYRLLSSIRQSVLRRSTALSTRHLRIEFSHLGADAGVIGAIWLALDHVFIVED